MVDGGDTVENWRPNVTFYSDFMLQKLVHRIVSKEMST